MAAITMTAHEQLLLELVNRARMDPQAELDRYAEISDLNAGLPAGTISAAPKQPLAPHQALIRAAGAHSQDMLDQDYFSHINLAGQTPTDRAQAAGYPTWVGENIAWGGSSGPIDRIAHVYERHKNLFLSPGHRRNIMADNYRDAGMGVRYGLYYYQSRDWNASMVTELFGTRGGNPLLTGVAYDDLVIDDDFYTVGEGVGGVTIQAQRVSDGATFTTRSGVSGGYVLQVPAGTYTITASGDSLDGVIIVRDVSVADVNVKVDLVTTTATPVLPISQEGIDLAAWVAGTWTVAVASGNQFDDQLWGQWSAAIDWQDFRAGDFDGDGDDDIAARGNGHWWVARSNGASFESAYWGSWSEAVQWRDVLVGDFNGDGRADLAGRANGAWWVAQSDGERFVNRFWSAWSNAVAWQDVQAADFDGDGRDDIAGRANGHWWIARSNGSQFNNAYWGSWSNTIDWQDVQTGDFNGDGRADLAGRGNGAWWVAESTGTRLVNRYWGSWSNLVTWSDVRVADVDGDGRSDIAGRANGNWWVARSVGSRFSNQYWASWSTDVAWSQVRVADVDLDGRQDLVGLAQDGSWWVARSDGSRFHNQYWGTWDGLLGSIMLVGNFA